MPNDQRPLKVFLSYASQDRPIVRELSRRLVAEGWIETWLDEESLLPGQDWRLKIEEAVDESDIVIICLSSNSVIKDGFVQKELRYAREISLEKPEESIFLVPLRLDNCKVPRGLRFYQWGDYFGKHKENTFRNLLRSLKERYNQNIQLEPGGTDSTNGGGGSAGEETASQDAPKEKSESKATLEGKPVSPNGTSLRDTLSKILVALRSIFPTAFPFLRVIGFSGIIIGLFWFGFWAIPKFSALSLTAKATATISPTIIKTSTVAPVVKMSTPRAAITSTQFQTLTPTALPEQITDTKNVPMVLVPEGKFIRGSDADAYYLDVDQKPAHNVFLDAFYIDT